MCGINGIIYKTKKADSLEVYKMNKAIKHRGPDDEGVYKFENVVLGHVRLSIIDLSEKGKQPMSNDGRYWISYNGEIYNFKEVKKQLLDLGHKFFSKTDTEVILNAYKQWGIESFHKFNGMWSFAILDNKEKKLILSRDRYGVKPCYYYNDNEKFLFSSEIKGIYSSDINLELDKNKLTYTQKSLEGAFTTIFKNCDIIPPGSYFIINLENYKIQKQKWWRGLDNLPLINVNLKKIKESLQDLLFDATRARLIADVDIATSLSGGVDSSIIFAILNRIYNEKNIDTNCNLNPFIVKYDENKTFNDAIEISDYFNKKPIIVKYDENTITNIGQKLSSIEMTAPYFSQLEVYKAQKAKGFKVSIDGHGADESLGGYVKDVQFFGMYFQNSIANLYKTIKSIEGETILNDIINKHKYISGLNEYTIDLEKLFFSNPKRKLLEYIESDEKIDLMSNDFKEDLIELKNYSLDFQIMYFNSTYGHMQWLLNKWDKASMASSVEVRSPFLDWRFFQYGLALPGELKIRNGYNKSILRETFLSFLPSKIMHNKIKQGLPIYKWKKNNDFIAQMNEIISQNSFLENNIWDGKKVRNDFNDFEKRNEKINSIWTLACTYLMLNGFKEIKQSIKLASNYSNENFNYLN